MGAEANVPRFWSAAAATETAARAAARNLAQFLEGYAAFARLPLPRIESVEWVPFVEGLRGAVSFRLKGALPAKSGRFDPAQLSQALINLLKNAHESGTAPDTVEFEILSDLQGSAFWVGDRGPGMSDEVLRNALLPFFTTKASGTGLGLAFCRDIAEAHGGRSSIANRDGGDWRFACGYRAQIDRRYVFLLQNVGQYAPPLRQ